MLLKPQTPEDPEGTPSAINKRLAIRAHDLQHQLQTLEHENKTLLADHKRLEAEYLRVCGILRGAGLAVE